MENKINQRVFLSFYIVVLIYYEAQENTRKGFQQVAYISVLIPWFWNDAISVAYICGVFRAE